MPYSAADQLVREALLARSIQQRELLGSAGFASRSQERLIMGEFRDERDRVGDNAWNKMGDELYAIAVSICETARTCFMGRRPDQVAPEERDAVFPFTQALRDMVDSLGIDRTRDVLEVMVRHYCEARYGVTWMRAARIDLSRPGNFRVLFRFD